MVDTHILVQGFGRKQRKIASSKKALFLKITAQARRLIKNNHEFYIFIMCSGAQNRSESNPLTQGRYNYCTKPQKRIGPTLVFHVFLLFIYVLRGAYIRYCVRTYRTTLQMAARLTQTPVDKKSTNK